MRELRAGTHGLPRVCHSVELRRVRRVDLRLLVFLLGLVFLEALWRGHPFAESLERSFAGEGLVRFEVVTSSGDAQSMRAYLSEGVLDSCRRSGLRPAVPEIDLLTGTALCDRSTRSR